MNTSTLKWFTHGIATLAITLIALRVAFPEVRAGIDNIALYLLLIATVAVLIPLFVPGIRKLSIEKLFEIEFRELSDQLPRVFIGERAPIPKDARIRVQKAPDLVRRWDTMKTETRDVFLVHVISPTNEFEGPYRWYDVYIYLTRTQSNNVSDVIRAEFFLGKWWEGDKAYVVENTGDRVGLATSAYGPTLCVCRVTFDDQSQVYLERMIDFEMGVNLGKATD